MTSNEFENKEEQVEIKEEVQPEQTEVNTSGEIELTPNDFKGYNYLKTPQVGQSVELTIKKIFSAPSRELVNSATGKKFFTGLENKTGKRKETILETIEGDRMTVDTWSLFFGLFGRECEFQKKANAAGTYEGIKIKINHCFNGRDGNSTPEDIQKLRSFKTLEEAKEHIAIVQKAMEDGTIYTVEVLE